MKRMFISAALVALLVATSYAGSGSKSEPNIDSETQEVPKTQEAPKKQEAPKRQGWGDILYGPLYGDVESVTFTSYDLADEFEEVVKGKCREKSVYKFNLKGDVEEAASYNGDGSLGRKELYKYDLQGNKIEYVHYNGDGSLTGKDRYKYDSQGNKIEYVFYFGGGLLSGKILYKYKYDSQGNKVEMADYYADGSLSWKAVCKYDEQGNLIERVLYKGEIMVPSFIEERIIVYRK